MKKKITAAGLMAKLSKDQDFVERRERDEEARQKRVDELLLALVPLFDELRLAGCNVTSASDLTAAPYPTAAPHADALPILLKHLQRQYAVDVRELIARALAVPEAKFGVDALARLYRGERDIRVKDGLAAAIAAAADDDNIGDVISLARDTQYGPSRALLLSALARSRDPRARATLRGLETDPDLAMEVRRLTGRQRARPTRTRASGELAEASMNFDSNLVVPFLERVSGVISGLGTIEIAEIARLIGGLHIDGEGELAFEVEHRGRAVPLRIVVFMSDVDAPDLHFFTAPALASDIDGLMTRFCEERGI